MKRLLNKRGLAILCVAAVAIVATIVVLVVSGAPQWPKDALFVADSASLRTALESAIPGQTIVLRAGSPYVGPFAVRTSGVTLGSSSGASLMGGGDEPCLSIEADGVAVIGLEIRAESTAIRMTGSDGRLDRVSIVDTPIGIQLSGGRSHRLSELSIDGGGTAVEVSSSGGNTFERLTIRGASETGIHFLGAWANVLSGIEIDRVPVGVSLDRGSTDNEIREIHITGASVAGIEARSSNENRLIDAELMGCRVGILLDVVSDCLVQQATIRDSEEGAILLQRSVRNRILENTVVSSLDVGISLSQSAENTLADNVVSECDGAGIRVDGSDGCLLLANEIRACGDGVETDRSSRMRILRNVIGDSLRAGLIVREGNENRLSDNVIDGGVLGVAMIQTTDSAVHRNTFRAASAIGLLAIGESRALAVTENQVTGCAVGVLLADSRDISLLDGRIWSNGTGILLTATGSGVRIEGNEILGNDIGLLVPSEVSDIGSGIESLGLDLSDEGLASSPVVHHNLFSRNTRLDIWNQEDRILSAGGNWWDEADDVERANVSAGVDVEVSAWAGTVAIGSGAETYQVVLGRVVQRALKAKGYRVIDLIGLGSDDRLFQALKERDVDVIWLGTSWTEDAIAGMETIPTQATRSWVVVATASFAVGLAGETLSDVAAWSREQDDAIRWAVPKTLGDGGFCDLLAVYGIDREKASVTWTESLDQSETLVKFGLAQVAVVENLQESLTASDFVALEDDLAAFPSAPITSVIRPALLVDHPEIGTTIEEITGGLTTDTIHGLVSRVRLLDRSPDDVAQEYLRRVELSGEKEI